MNKNQKPNGVLFHLDDGKVVMILRKNNEFDWNDCRKIDEDMWKDLSIANPFEFVFIYYDTTDPEQHNITTYNKKSIIQSSSFLKLYSNGALKTFIDIDYKTQYEGLTDKMLNDESGWKVIGRY